VNSAGTIRLIDTQGELDRIIETMARAPRVAVDTEAASFHRYRDRVYLLQLSTHDLTAVVDPLAVTDLSAFGALLAEPSIEVVFHDADYDLRLLAQEYGYRATRLFDTRVAAQLLNEPGVGLAALLETYLGVRLDKRFQRADWSARPLSAGMLEYAAADTHHLLELRDILHGKLEQMGRLHWAEEEFALLEQVQWAEPEDGAEPAWLRMKGAKALKPRQLAVLREVFEWRDGLARRLDRASFRIMNNEPILTIAREQPGTAEELGRIPGIGRDALERRGGEILAAVRRGLDVPEADLPRVERQPRRAADAEFDARVERLKVVRNQEAERLQLAPGVLCPNGTLEGIARKEPKTSVELRTIPFIRRWQVEAIGDVLLAALRTP